MLSVEAKEDKPKTLSRKKREWILPPAKIVENVDYTKREFIAKVIWLLLVKILFPQLAHGGIIKTLAKCLDELR